MGNSLVVATNAQLATAAPNWVAMKSAIEECAKIDEVRSVADKLTAMRVYYAQSKDVENEVAAMRVRIRAEKRLGELINDGQRDRSIADKGKPTKMSSATTLTELGINRNRAARAQQLASIPDKQFEAALAQPRPSLRAMTKKQEQAVDRVLKTWGAIRDFAAGIEDGKFLEPDGWTKETGIQPFQITEIRAAIPKIVDYLTQLELEVKK